MVDTTEMYGNADPSRDKGGAILQVSRGRFWVGWIISALPALFLLSSGINAARRASFVTESFAHLGYGENLALGIGIAEFVCAALYLFPRTSFLGAVLLTGYLGGATASHVRVGDVFAAPVVVAVFIWLGLLLRDHRLSEYVFGAFKPAGRK